MFVYMFYVTSRKIRDKTKPNFLLLIMAMVQILSTEMVQYTLLASFAVFGLLQLLCVLLFWLCHLRHHQNHAVYRIRHPKFWIFCIALSSFDITWKAMISYLRIREQISVDLYQILNSSGVLLFEFGGCFCRGFVLWYTVTFQQREETLLFERVLGSQDTSTEFQRQSTRNYDRAFLYRYEKHMSNPLRVFVYLESLYVALCVIGWLLTLTVTRVASKHYIISIAMLFWLVLTFLVCAMWRNGYKIDYKVNGKDISIKTRFLDYFNFRWEITIIWLDIFIFIPLRSIAGIHLRFTNAGLVVLAFLTLLSQLFPALTQIILPLWTYKKCKKSSAFSRHAENTNEITVLDVLSDKHGVFLFMLHAVQELNLENISCLIAIFQFKCMNTSRNEWMNAVNPLQQKARTTDKIIEVNDETPRNGDIFNVEHFASELAKLPWNNMPFTKSLSNMMDTKYVQAQKIHNKFINTGMGSIYSVNISATSRQSISDTFEAMQQKCEDDKSWTKNAQFQKELTHVFDIVLPDLFTNLMDMMGRFRTTKNFQLLSIT
eukprot:942639_1